MRSLVNFLAFQAFWLVAVWSAAGGRMWPGPAAAVLLVALHLRLVSPAERGRELRYVVAIGLAGTVIDTALRALGATTYPTSTAAWPFLVVPPWIASLWVAFATLPRFSLAWLTGRPLLAALLGAVGGPLSFLAGTRFGSVAIGESAALTLGALALEYAVAVPIMLALAGAPSRVQARSTADLEPGPA